MQEGDPASKTRESSQDLVLEAQFRGAKQQLTIHQGVGTNPINYDLILANSSDMILISNHDIFLNIGHCFNMNIFSS